MRTTRSIERWTSSGARGTRRPRPTTFWRPWASDGEAFTTPSAASGGLTSGRSIATSFFSRRSKRGTYLRTLDRYLLLLKEGGPYRALSEAEPGVGALRTLLGSYLDSVASEGGAHGCYFVHVAKEHRGDDPEVVDAIRRGIAQMKVILTDHMKVAQEQGVLPDHIDPETAALLMMAVAWGGHVLIEAGVDKDDALQAARAVFEMNPKPA